MGSFFRDKITAIQNRDKLIYFVLFAIAFVVIFTSTYNPMNFRRMHVDSSVYVTIAQGITRGQLPYRDFVDNKGPLLYLVIAAGLRLGGFTGIWIMELIFLCFSVFFAYKTALFFGDRFKALLGTVFSFIVFLAFFTVSAGTEKISLPFLMVSLYIFTKYFFSPERKVSFGELVVLGASFTCAVMIRLNMFPLWLGFCVVILIESLAKRHFAQLGKYIFGFCLGIIAAGMPLFLYLSVNGIMDVFIEQVVFGGAARGFGATGLKVLAQNFFVVVHRNSSIVPLAVGLFWILTKFGKSTFVFSLAYFLSCFMMVLFLSFSTGGSHWNIVIVPFFVPALTFLVGIVYQAFPEKKTKIIFTVAFFLFVFSEGILKYLDDLSEIVLNNSGMELINAGRMIDENTNHGDTIISLGFNAYIYPFTQRNAASRFFYQGSGLNHIYGAREEFISDILTNRPSIIALFTAEDGDGSGSIMPSWHAPILEMIENEYRILSTENGFILWIRN